MDVDASTVAAWWGAVLATIVFIWEIYKWSRTGARLRVTANPEMQQVIPDVGIEPELYINLVVANVGDAPTTITHLLGYVFASRWQTLRGKRIKAFVILPGQGANYPHLLEPGNTWSAWILQSEVERFMAKGHIIHVGIHHSMAEKAATAYVQLSPPSS